MCEQYQQICTEDAQPLAFSKECGLEHERELAAGPINA